MHTATLLIPILAALAQAAPQPAAPKTDDYSDMPSPGQGQALARAQMKAAGQPVGAAMYVFRTLCRLRTMC